MHSRIDFQSGCRQQWESLGSDLANGNILGHLNPNSQKDDVEITAPVVFLKCEVGIFFSYGVAYIMCLVTSNKLILIKMMFLELVSIIINCIFFKIQEYLFIRREIASLCIKAPFLSNCRIRTTFPPSTSR